MNWNALFETLGGTIVLCAVAGWLVRKLISQFLNKDIELFKQKLISEAARDSYKFTMLHEKRANFIAELYERLLDVQSSVYGIRLQYQGRIIREDSRREMGDGGWKLNPGRWELNESESKSITNARDALSEAFKIYKGQGIFLNDNMCTRIDKILSLSGYIHINYSNVAIKDDDGRLMVDPVVKEIWDKAHELLPGILNELRSEFQLILGVK